MGSGGSGDRCHFLLVEDGSDDAALLWRAFSKLPEYSYFLCGDVFSAMNYLGSMGNYVDREQFPLPDVVLCDLYLGAEDGLFLLQWCRKQETVSSIPFVFLTGSENPADMERALKLGAAKVFQKRFNQSDIIQLLTTIVRTLVHNE